VDKWLRQQPNSLRVRAEFWSLFKRLAVLPKGQWPPKRTFMMKKEFSELREFRVKVGRGQYRLAGFEGPEGEITLFPGWTRSQNRAAQRSAQERALGLKQAIEQGEVTTVDHEI